LIGISKLYCGTIEPSDPIRYGRDTKKLPSHLLQFSQDKKPIVVWNITKSCNLRCIHCYANAELSNKEDKINYTQALSIIDDLAEFGVPVILFSGGEPLLRSDIIQLIEYTTKKGIRAVLSTNGTLINKDIAIRLKDAGISYVGISLDGLENINDYFRGIKGAFNSAMKGIANCKNIGIKVGLRFTINRFNANEIPNIFDLVEKEDIDRVCFYHLVYSGRGTSLINDDLSHTETRKIVDLIIDKTKKLHNKGLKKEVLTVDNHADGPYLYIRMLNERNPRAEKVLELLKMNGGNSSGNGIGCISWDGSVHADQFWRHYKFGNVLEKPFSKIWTDTSDPLMAKLKNKKKYLKGKCAKCKWLDICAGNFRVRAEAVTGDIWAPDPACYLTNEEIGI